MNDSPPDPNSREEIISELEKYADYLRKKLRATSLSIDILRDKPIVRLPDRRQGTMVHWITSTLMRVGRANLMTLTNEMLEQGWETTSENPANTVRSALVGMIRCGDVARGGDGFYRLSGDEVVYDSGEAFSASLPD